MKKLLMFLLVFMAALTSYGNFVKDMPKKVTQPDGQKIDILVSGDEFYVIPHDLNGYTIIQDPQTGYWVYAELKNDELVPTNYVLGQADPNMLPMKKYLSIPVEQIYKIREKHEEYLYENSPKLKSLKAIGANIGDINNLAVFIRFADEDEITSRNFDFVSSMFNDSTENANSMYNYFKFISYKRLFLRTYFYPEPVDNRILSYKDSQPRSYYQPYNAVTNVNGYKTSGEQRSRRNSLLTNAVLYIADAVPEALNIDHDGDGNVDNVVFIVSGNQDDWADLLWPHRSALTGGKAIINNKKVSDYIFVLLETSTYFNNGTNCHEMTHALGAPDLYHYNYEGPTPTGKWELMETNLNPPQGMGLYMKYKYGRWIEDIPEITKDGTYKLVPHYNRIDGPIGYKIPSPNKSQFYIIEYRTKEGWDKYIPGEGLVIYRINSIYNGNASWNGQSSFDEVYIYRNGGTTTKTGSLTTAAFSSDYNREMFNETTNPVPFLCNGTVDSLLNISNISFLGDTMSFTYTRQKFQFAVDQPELQFEPVNEVKYLNLTSNVYWESLVLDDWIKIAPKTGSIGREIKITVEENNTVSQREGFIYFTTSYGDTLKVKVFQDYNSEKYIIVSDDNVTLKNEVGNNLIINVESNLVWSATSDKDWLMIEPANGENNGSVTLKLNRVLTEDEDKNAIVLFNTEFGSKTVNVNVKNSEGLDNIFDNSLNVYPNPNNGNFSIDVPYGYGDDMNLEVLDISGRVVFRNNYSGDKISVYIPDVEKGIYFIKLYGNGKRYSGKIIINN